MSSQQDKLVSAVGAKLMLLLLAWAAAFGVTWLFDREGLSAAAALVEQASQEANSIIPLLSAAGLVVLLFAVAALSSQRKSLQYAAECSAEIAGDVGSVFFVSGFSVLIVFIVKHGAERGILAAALLFLSVALVAASKRFGA